MRHTSAVLVVSIVLGAVVAPLVVSAQNARVGVFAGSIPPDATVGVMAGTLPPNATVGSLAGAIPAGATVGSMAGTLPTGASAGVLLGAIPEGAKVGVLLGAIPEGATLGVLTPGFAPGTGMGEALPADVARGLESLARTHLTDHAFANTEALLRRSESLEAQRLGPDDPEVARLLDRHAALLRTKGREAAAGEMESRAQAIRTRIEEASRGESSLAEQIGLP